MDDKVPVTQYVYEMNKMMKDSLDRVEKKLDTNTDLTVETRDLGKKTNGRVTVLEGWSNDMKDTIEILAKSVEQNRDNIVLIENKHKSDIRAVQWIVVLTGFFIGCIAVLLQENIKNYNASLIQNQLSTAQKKTETSYNNTVNVQ